MPEVKLLPISAIDVDKSFSIQIRPEMNEEHVAEMVAALAESDQEQREKGFPPRDDVFPPLVMFVSDGLGILGDGLHRLDAYIKSGRESCRCEVHQVEDPLFEARAYSLKSNRGHGLPRDRATKRRVWERSREMFPTLHPFGPNGLQGKTGLSNGAIGDYMREDANRGIPTTYQKPHRSRPDRSPRSARTQAEDFPVPSGAPGNDRGDLSKNDNPRCPDLEAYIRDVGALIAKGDKLVGLRGAEFFDAALAGRSLMTAQELAKRSRFHSWCPRCHPEGSKPGLQPRRHPPAGCKLCKGAGFITAIQFGRLDDREQAQAKTLS